MAGLATSGLVSVAPRQAFALPSDPAAGPVVTPDPLPDVIQKSGLAVELVDFAKPPRTSSKPSFTMLNFLYHAGTGTKHLYACDSRGKMWRIDRTTGAVRLFFDLKKARGSAFLTEGVIRSHTGFRGFAFHPSFAKSGQLGFRKLYTVHTEKPATPPAGVPVFSGSYPVHHHAVVAEWTVAASGTKVDPASRRELLRIAMWQKDHSADQLMFDPNAKLGSLDYGKMFIGVGDGGNNANRPDPFNQAQDLRSALGKILRIDPLGRTGGRPYGVPGDNPFVGRGGEVLPEIWAYGLRHPQNLSFDTGGTGALIIADIGQEYIEEINLGVKGANYGWPLREGTFVTDRQDGRVLYAPPADEGTKGFTPPAAQYDHFEGGRLIPQVAVVGGFVYRGTAVPALVGHYIFGDIVSGRVFHIPVSELKLGTQATIKELTLLKSGQPVTLLALVGTNNGRADLRFGQDQSGEVYIMTKQDGVIRKIRAASPVA